MSTAILGALRALFREKQFNAMIELARPELERSPYDGKLWELCGMAFDAVGNSAKAIDALEAASLLVPLTPAGQCVLAKNYASIGQRNLARDMYRFLLSIESLPSELLPVVAAGLGSVGDVARALEACRRAAAHDLHDGQPLYGMAHYMERLEYPTEVVASVLRKAVEIEPEKFRYRFALAMACEKLGRSEEAYDAISPVVDCRRLERISCAMCLRRMAAIFEQAGDSAKGNACLMRLEEVKQELRRAKM